MKAKMLTWHSANASFLTAILTIEYCHTESQNWNGDQWGRQGTWVVSVGRGGLRL